MADQEREPTDNFHTRLKVQTAYPDGFKDHREGFHKEQYFFNNQNEPRNTERSGFVPLNNRVAPPKPKAGTKQISPKPNKSKADLDLEAANKKDIKNRRIKNQ